MKFSLSNQASKIEVQVIDIRLHKVGNLLDPKKDLCFYQQTILNVNYHITT
jgi:hypothetical protein